MGSIRSQAGGRLSHFEGETKTIFLKCSKSRSKTRNGSASFIRIQRAQERQISSSYEEMTVVLPGDIGTKDDVSCDHGWSYRLSYEPETSPKVASHDIILRGLRPRLFSRLPWSLRDVLGEDKAHLEPLYKRRDVTSMEEAKREPLYIHLQP